MDAAGRPRLRPRACPGRVGEHAKGRVPGGSRRRQRACHLQQHRSRRPAGNVRSGGERGGRPGMARREAGRTVMKFTNRGWLIASVVAVLVLASAPVWMAARERAKRDLVAKRLRYIALAIHTYKDGN